MRLRHRCTRQGKRRKHGKDEVQACHGSPNRTTRVNRQ
jgi:hypothetical protein